MSNYNVLSNEHRHGIINVIVEFEMDEATVDDLRNFYYCRRYDDFNRYSEKALLDIFNEVSDKLRAGCDIDE